MKKNLAGGGGGGGGLWMKKINIFNCKNSSDLHYIVLTPQVPPCHYRHLQLFIGECHVFIENSGGSLNIFAMKEC